MSQKIGIILMALLVVCSVWLLRQTQMEAAALHAPETTAPTAAQTTAPETEDTAPSEETQENQETQETQGQPELILTELSQSAQRVMQHLDRSVLTATAPSGFVYIQELNAIETTVGTAKNGWGQGLAELGSVLRVNPIAAFWQLVTAGVYEKTVDSSGALASGALKAPQQGAKSYAYTADGVRQLLTDLLTLAGQMDDGLALEAALLGAESAVKEADVHESQADGCYYAYLACGGDRSSHILCFYLRPDKAGNLVADVEFQLLNLTAAIGNPEVLTALNRRGTHQAAALMAAAELLMTGKTQVGQGNIPFSYSVGGLKAKLERFTFQANGEWGELINYRVKA